MAVTVKDLREWLANAPDDALVGIAIDGVLLATERATFEIGCAPKTGPDLAAKEQCYLCGARIGDAEYLVNEDGLARHFCCPR